jgi:hypothetical protein
MLLLYQIEFNYIVKTSTQLGIEILLDKKSLSIIEPQVSNVKYRLERKLSIKEVTKRAKFSENSVKSHSGVFK